MPLAGEAAPGALGHDQLQPAGHGEAEVQAGVAVRQRRHGRAGLAQQRDVAGAVVRPRGEAAHPGVPGEVMKAHGHGAAQRQAMPFALAAYALAPCLAARLSGENAEHGGGPRADQDGLVQQRLDAFVRDRQGDVLDRHRQRRQARHAGHALDHVVARVHREQPPRVAPVGELAQQRVADAAAALGSADHRDRARREQRVHGGRGRRRAHRRSSRSGRAAWWTAAANGAPAALPTGA